MLSPVQLLSSGRDDSSSAGGKFMHRNKHGSKASLNSNDIVVVEEVED